MAAKHRIPLGTKVAFKGDPKVYEVCDYSEVLKCEDNCELAQGDGALEHECVKDPHICVREVITRSKPLSQLRLVFDLPGGVGRVPTFVEKEVVREE